MSHDYDDRSVLFLDFSVFCCAPLYDVVLRPRAGQHGGGGNNKDDTIQSSTNSDCVPSGNKNVITMHFLLRFILGCISNRRRGDIFNWIVLIIARLLC